jgi:hypothetical protein
MLQDALELGGELRVTIQQQVARPN